MIRILVSLTFPLFLICSFGLFIPFLKRFKYTKAFLMSALLMSGLLCLFTILYFKMENTIYFWDSSGQWSNLIYLKKAFDWDLSSVFYELYQSMCFSEYSKLPAFFILFPIQILGLDFSSFVFSMVLLFIIPLCCSFSILVLRSQKEEKQSRIKTLLITLFSFLFVPFLFSTFEGEAGVVCLYFMILIYWVMEEDKATQFSVFRVLFLVFCILNLIFIRRWTLFWIVGYFSSTFFIFAYKWIRKEINGRKFGNVLMNYALVTVLVLILLLFGFRGFLTQIISSNYSDAYVAYRLSFSEQLLHTFNFYGLLLIILLGLGIVIGIKNKSLKTVQLLLQIGITAFLFLQVQNFDNHHYFLFAIEVGFLVSNAMLYLYDLLSFKVGTSLWIFVILISVLLKMFIPIQQFDLLLGKTKNVPEVRNDMVQLKECVEDLNQVTEGKSLIILASSLKYNDQIFNNVNLPYEMDALKSRIPTRHIDERDGFPDEIFDVDYLLIPSVAQIHKDASHQKIIVELPQILMLDYPEFYEEIKTYSFDDVDFKLFHRINEFSEIQRETIKEKTFE